MTAWQDQPPMSSKPLSRRQVRENERGESTDGGVDVANVSAEQPDFAGFPREGWDTEARRVSTEPEESMGAPTGRRSQRAVQPSEQAKQLEAEPFEYFTQGRTQAPSDDGQQLRRRPVSAVENENRSGAAGYRARDFSPGGRPSFSSTAPETEQPISDESEDLRYRTHNAAMTSASAAIRAAEAQDSLSDARVADLSMSSAPFEERTISRRELRAMEASRAAATDVPEAVNPFAALFTPEPVASEPVASESVASEPVAPEAAAVAEPSVPATVAPVFEAPAVVTPELVTPELVTPELATPAPTALNPFEQLFTPAAALPDSEAPEAPAALVEPLPTLVEPEQLMRRSRDRPLSTEQDYRSAVDAAETTTPAIPAEMRTIFSGPIEQAAPVAAPVSPRPANPFDDLVASAPEEPSTWTPPTGHWSTQALIDDDEQVQENTVSRNIGMTSGAVTTNALIIPLLPIDDMTRPLGSTGEILITGIIDLPRSYGSTGAVPSRYDHSDVDTFLEASDREDAEANPDSAPVRAIRAVNTHTSTLGAMDTKKQKGASRLPFFLGVAATVLAVGIVVLVVGAMIFGVFK